MVDAVTPTEDSPDFHLTLTSGATTMGFLLCDSQGKVVQTGSKNWPIRVFPLEQRGLQTFEGQGDYDASRWPYMTIQQSDFSGGIGGEVFDDDHSKVMDSYRMDTTKQGKVFMAGAETFSYGHKTIDCGGNNAGSITNGSNRRPQGLQFYDLYSTTRYRAAAVEASASYNAEQLYFIIRKVGTPGTLTLALYSDNSGPNAALKTVTVAATDLSDVLSVLKLGDIATQAVTGAAIYWGVIYGAATDDATNHWQVGCAVHATLDTGRVSANGTNWTAVKQTPWFMVQAAPLSWGGGKFLKYKAGLYFMSQPITGNSLLYLNGDRGAADDNTGALTTLVDATKSWVVNEWIGSYAVLTAGPGSEEAQPWRLITGNDATSLTVSSAWNVVHTTNTEYVIVGSDKWQSVEDLGAYCTDACVASGVIYFARGYTANVLRYEAYNNAGAWTDRQAAETDASYRANSLASIYNPDDGERWVYGINRNFEVYPHNYVWGLVSPPTWADMYYPLSQLCNTNTAWDEQAIANVTQSTSSGYTKITVAAGFTTGNIASEIVTSTNIMNARALGFLMFSTVAATAGQITMKIASTASLGGTPMTVNVPDLVANTWTWVEIPITPTLANPDCRAIISIGFALAADLGAMSIYLGGGIQLIGDQRIAALLPSDEMPLGMIAYSGSTTDPRENPWIRTSGHWYELQTQNANALVPMPIGEMKELADDTANFAACVNDVYLYFALTDRIERYTQRNMEDISVQSDYFPISRVGMPTALVSYPGRVFAALDGGSTNYSSIIVRRGNAWHEFYRAPEINQHIHAMINEKLPGNGTGRLWFLKDSDLMYLPTSLDPLNDANYPFTYEGSIETGWIYVNMRALVKLWRYLSAFSENVNGTSNFIYADYMTDAATSWTAITDDFISPDETNELSASPVTAKRMRLRFRFYSTSAYRTRWEGGTVSAGTNTMNAWTLSAFGIDDTKYGYQFSFVIADKDLEINDLTGEESIPLGTDNAVEDALSRLQAYIAAGTPMTVGCIFSPINGKIVKVQPYALTPLRVDPEDQVEKHLVQVTLYEI